MAHYFIALNEQRQSYTALYCSVTVTTAHGVSALQVLPQEHDEEPKTQRQGKENKETVAEFKGLKSNLKDKKEQK